VQVIRWGAGYGVFGQPRAVDLLHTTDRGQHWLEVLRWAYSGVNGPRVPSPPGGTRMLPTMLAGTLGWLAAPRPDAARVAFTDELGNQTGFGATSDGGLNWHFWSFPNNLANPRTVPAAALPPPLSLLQLTALGARRAWMVLAASPHATPSYLYGTDNGGATWTEISKFGAP
jgi:hypothetical protein